MCPFHGKQLGKGALKLPWTGLVSSVPSCSPRDSAQARARLVIAAVGRIRQQDLRTRPALACVWIRGDETHFFGTKVFPPLEVEDTRTRNLSTDTHLIRRNDG